MRLEPDFLHCRQSGISQKPRFPIQWNLRSLLVLTATVAVWVAYFHFQYEIPRIEQEIAPLRRLARKLNVEDHRQIAIVRLHQIWGDEERWDVYIPKGAYALRLATREISDAGTAPLAEEKPISPGRHRIVLRKSYNDSILRYTVEVDDLEVFDFPEASERGFCDGFIGSLYFSECEQLSPGEPAIFYRGRFGRPTQRGHLWSDAPTNGLLLWIERLSH